MKIPILTQYKYEIYLFLVFFLWAIAHTMEYNDLKAQECKELKLQYNSTTGRCELWVDDLKQYDQSKRISV